MFRYMTLIWDPNHSERTATAAQIVKRLAVVSGQWHTVFDDDGMRVICADERPGAIQAHVLSQRAGAIVGTVFERTEKAEDDDLPSKARFGVRETRSIVDSMGAVLVHEYWGNYVAFLVCPTPNCKNVLKDPTGSLPCFETEFRGVRVFFSCIADCVALDLMTFSVNWAYVRAHLGSGGRDVEHNPLTEVRQLNHGELLRVDRSGGTNHRRFLWNPVTLFTERERMEDPHVAAREMRRTLRSCTYAWASCHDRILHRLSGGLDSSIILGCLRSLPTTPEIRCYTYYQPEHQADERPWAKLAVDGSGFRHIEVPFEPRRIRFETLLEQEPSVEPLSVIGYIERSRAERTLTSDWEATAVFSGDGGDCVLCSDSIGLAVDEYLDCHGISREVFTLASRVALCRDLSVWTVLRRALGRWIFGSKLSNQRELLLEGSKLVHTDIKECLVRRDNYPHPWFGSTKGAPWGLIRRLGILIYPPEFYDVFSEPHARGQEWVAPMYSQPFVELCLRIPSYLHFERGRDRGLARRAFAQDVPTAILNRQWKDRAPGFFDELTYRNRDFIRELLIDGYLVREGLLDGAAVERALSDNLARDEVLPGEILNHLDVEIWVRSWTDKLLRRAAA